MSFTTVPVLMCSNPRCDDNVSSLSYFIDQAHARASEAERRADHMDVDNP